MQCFVVLLEVGVISNTACSISVFRVLFPEKSESTMSLGAVLACTQ